jgi:hypothetical protein
VEWKKVRATANENEVGGHSDDDGMIGKWSSAARAVGRENGRGRGLRGWRWICGIGGNCGFGFGKGDGEGLGNGI